MFEGCDNCRDSPEGFLRGMIIPVRFQFDLCDIRELASEGFFYLEVLRFGNHLTVCGRGCGV